MDAELDECFDALCLTQLVTEPTPSVSNLVDVFASISSSLAASIKVVSVDHLCDQCLITVDVVGRVSMNELRARR